MNLIGTNENFARAYSLDQRNHSLKEDFEFYYDEGFVDFMIKALKHGKNIDFSGYDKLDKLFEYMHNLLYMQDKEEKSIYKEEYLRRVLENKERNKINEISDFAFEDSYLLKFEMIHRKDACEFYFYNVLLYGDKRKEKIYDVETGNIVLNFREVKEIKLKGSFDFEFLKFSRVYSSKYYKVSDTLYCFELLCIANYEHFIIQIIFSGVSAEEFENESTDFMNN